MENTSNMHAIVNTPLVRLRKDADGARVRIYGAHSLYGGHSMYAQLANAKVHLRTASWQVDFRLQQAIAT